MFTTSTRNIPAIQDTTLYWKVRVFLTSPDLLSNSNIRTAPIIIYNSIYNICKFYQATHRDQTVPGLKTSTSQHDCNTNVQRQYYVNIKKSEASLLGTNICFPQNYINYVTILFSPPLLSTIPAILCGTFYLAAYLA